MHFKLLGYVKISCDENEGNNNANANDYDPDLDNINWFDGKNNNNNDSGNDANYNDNGNDEYNESDKGSIDKNYLLPFGIYIYIYTRALDRSWYLLVQMHRIAGRNYPIISY